MPYINKISVDDCMRKVNVTVQYFLNYKFENKKHGLYNNKITAYTKLHN